MAPASTPQRWDYTGAGLTAEHVGTSPWACASGWVEEAERRAVDDPALHEPTAMAVATVDADGVPDVREVLMRFFDPTGPGFISSRHSAKAVQLSAGPAMAAALTWSPLFRAIRFRGTAVELPAELTTAYWRQRPWGARISAWASEQSHPVADRDVLEERVRSYGARWPDRGGPDDVPVPEDWVGWRIECDQVEFWAGRADRLHDRFRFTRVGPGDLDTATAWQVCRLQP